MRNLLITLIVIGLAAISCDNRPSQKESHFIKISKSTYEDKVYAYWLGQLIGVTYGLPYEFKFIDHPGPDPDSIPYGFSWSFKGFIQNNGVGSDDDTDIEYMYLLAMEKYGTPEPTYYELAAEWKEHIRDGIWAANNAALALMKGGWYPPFSGSHLLNPDWAAIDPQLINEIWAVTAPMMVDYSVGKSTWTGKICSDSLGLGPTRFYAAMYAAAFGESDYLKLIDTGLKAIGEDSNFGKVVNHMKALHEKYPDQWQKAREEVNYIYNKHRFYNNEANWPPINAEVNGAVGVLAMLYGRGDIKKTLDMTCAMGYDADNQAATITSLLCIAHGSAAIPEHLIFPIDSLDWQEPFNDLYVMSTRHNLPSAGIKDMAARTVLQGEKLILMKGGNISEENGETFYLIPGDAEFNPPLELTPYPEIIVEAGQDLNFAFYAGGNAATLKWELEGAIPAGIQFENGRLTGNTESKGLYEFTLTVDDRDRQVSNAYTLRVLDGNKAPTAVKIISTDEHPADDLEILRNGILHEKTIFSRKLEVPGRTYWGYTFATSQRLEAIAYSVRNIPKNSGWFYQPYVEYIDQKGRWTRVKNQQSSPLYFGGYNGNYQIKGSKIYFVFDPVETTGIRLAGQAGGKFRDGKMQFFTGISELGVY